MIGALRGVKASAAAAVFAGSLVLAGCAAASPSDAALRLCVDAVQAEVGATIDASGITSADLGGALFDAGITDSRSTDEGNAIYTVTGDFTWEKDGTETRKTLICTVEFVDGQAGSPDVTIA